MTALMLAAPLSASGQSGLTLAQAVARAQQRAPAERAAQAALRSADASVDVAGMRPNPSLSVEAENVLGSGRYAGFGGGERTVALSVPFELGGKRQARINLAQAERSIALLGATAARADIALRVTEAFIAAAAAERQLAAARTGKELADQAAQAATERVNAGKASPIEAQRAEVVRINASVKATKAERARAVAAADLARLLGESLPGALTSAWFDNVACEAGIMVQSEPLPVQLATLQLGAARARVDTARSERVPDITLTAGTRRLAETSARTAVLGISVPLPLFNTGSAALTRSQAEQERVAAELETIAADAQRDIAHAAAELADAREAASAANGPALAAAQEAARIARIGYSEGKFGQLDLLDAYRSLADTREAAIDALAAFHLARARLARLQGHTDSIYKD